jgi:DNA-binding SARP family transcriptional activator
MIEILGPLRIAGQRELQLRDRVVLGVLAVQCGRAVPAEEIADAMWGERPPTSSRKVIQGSVVRLRRFLRADVIATVAGGYRLDLAEAELDAIVFQSQVVKARAELGDGRADRAALRIAEAMTLWRGAPHAELAEWEPARAAARQWDALRETAEDLRLEALLLAGKSAEAVAEAERLAGFTPYREQRWALLARILYAAGRQADALAALARERRTLAEDLGIDPSPKLAALEVAILNHDASLEVPTAVTGVDSCPWPGLLPYEATDSERFFGRDAEIADCLAKLGEAATLVLVGGSGSGKSSLARAGLVPRLGPSTIITPGPDPIAALEGLDPARILVVDQIEEVVTQGSSEEARQAFFDAVRAHPGPVIAVARADKLDQLSAYPTFAALLQRGLFVLPFLDEAGLRTVIHESAARVGLRLEPGLIELLLQDCRLEPASLPLLSHALSETWRLAEGNLLSVAGYQATGGIRGAVAATADEVYLSLPPEDQLRMRRLFLRLVVDEGEPVRLRLPRESLPDERLVELLLRSRLVSVVGDGDLQLAHEALARHWPRLCDWLDDDREGQRVVRHITQEARDWSGQGRPISSLYRGGRLAAAQAWVAANPGALTATEQGFLDASAAAADTEIRGARRSNRRLRLSLVAVVLLLGAAVVGGALAVRQARAAASARDNAQRARDASEGLRLGTLAESRQSPSVALGLAAQALATDDTQDIRVHALEAFSHFPALRATDADPARPAWAGQTLSATSGEVATSADGALRVRVSGSRILVDQSRRPLRTIQVPARMNALALDRSGRLLAAGFSEMGFATSGTTVVWDLRSGTELQRFKSGDGAVWAHRFSPDGSTLTSYGADGLHVWDLTGSRSLVRLDNGDPIAYRAGEIVLSLTDPTVSAWIDLACQLAGRPLTNTEWREYVGDRPYRPTCR